MQLSCNFFWCLVHTTKLGSAYYGRCIINHLSSKCPQLKINGPLCIRCHHTGHRESACPRILITSSAARTIHNISHPQQMMPPQFNSSVPPPNIMLANKYSTHTPDKSSPDNTKPPKLMDIVIPPAIIRYIKQQYWTFSR